MGTWFYIAVIAMLAGPLSWALGQWFDYSNSLEWEAKRGRPFWVITINTLKIAGFILLLMIVNQLFIGFGVVPPP